VGSNPTLSAMFSIKTTAYKSLPILLPPLEFLPGRFLAKKFSHSGSTEIIQALVLKRIHFLLKWIKRYPYEQPEKSIKTGLTGC
jgi:hypothetical protein